MDRFAYLFMTLALCATWLTIFGLRKDLRRKMLRVGVPGAIAGAIAEWWYFHDYWQPPTVVGTGIVSPEDFLVGAAITGIGIAAYMALTGRRSVPADRPRKKEFLLLFVLCIVLLVLGSDFLKLPSIILSEALFAAVALAMVAVRRDLLAPCLATGLLCGILMLPIYAVAFGLLAPQFWHTHWMLDGTPMGIYLGAGIPLTEFLWFVTWGMLAGVASHFRSGTRPARI